MSETATTSRPLSEGELRGLVAAFQQADDGQRLLLVDAAPSWDGPDELTTDSGTVRIVTAASVLAARAAVIDHDEDEYPLVLLTDRDQHELGIELVARAWKGRPVRPTPWDGVLSLFRAESLDAPVRAHRWLVDVLVDLAPERGYPQPPGGVLTLDRAWRALHRILGLPEEPAASDVVKWARDGTAAQALAAMDGDATEGILRHLDDDITACATDVHRASAGSDADVVVLGLVLDSLGVDPDPVPRSLLESLYLGEHWPTDRARTAWIEVSSELYLDAPPDDRRSMDAAAEKVLDRVKGTALAGGELLSIGLRNAVSRLAERLGEALDGEATAADVERAVTAVGRHRATDASRTRHLDAAVRLLRWQEQGDAADDSASDAGLTDLTLRYAQDGAWVDAALQQVAQGDTNDDLAAALHALRVACEQQREAADRMFAAAVAEEACARAPEASLDNERPLRIEDVLDVVLTPLARQAPVLLLVIDGLSHAAAIPVLEDLQAAGWEALGPQGRPTPEVVAALPTVTVHSRATLLSGRLASGGQDVERTNFTGHTGLIEAGGGQSPALLHRSALRQTGGEVAPHAREVIADPTQRVVGVVFNGVDDFLSSNGQLQLADGLEGLPLLEPLLDAALEAGRVVVLTSDHGHVLSGETARHAPGGGERFRLPDTGDPDEHEVLLRGPRVLRGGDDGVVAAADGTYRYLNLDKRGYHGGATPAEALCPLHVLATPAADIEGWEPTTVVPPAWWSGNDVDVPADIGELALAADDTSLQYATEPEAPQPGLFDAMEQEQQDDWPAALVQSDTYAAQLRLVTRKPAERDVLIVLRLAEAGGGSAAGSLLQRALDTTPTRLRSRLEAVRAALTVDGYAGLRVETDGSVQLDREVLRQQFGVTDA